MSGRFVAVRRAAARNAVRVATVVAVVFGASYPALAGNSPQGDSAVAWPTTWYAYRMADGSIVQDVLGDENPDNADLSSGSCTGAGCTGGLPTVYYASDGTNAFFRMRLYVDPADATKGGLTGNAYLTQIAVGGVVRAVVGVDGKSASVDYVYTATAPGTTVTQIYTYPFTSPSAGMRVLAAPDGHWFLDYQVPIARITTASGGTITAATPIQLYYGSSAAANLATINKDFMLGDVDATSFDDLAEVSFSAPALTAASSKVGPASPVVATPSTYTVTLTLTNPGGAETATATATATLPPGVTYVSGPGAVSVSGSTLTWNAGALYAFDTKTVDVTLSLTPAAEGPTTLLSALAASAGTLSANAPALTVDAVAPPPNVAPVAADDVLTVAEDGSDTVNVLANDGDSDGDVLTVTPSDPAHGSVTESGGVVTYTPDAGYAGPDSFTYEVCDPSGACDTATVTVTVTPVNDAPPAPPTSSFDTPEDTPHTGTLPGSVDPDGDALTFGETDEPDHGTVTIDADGDYTYTPDPGYFGPDSFGYEVCDPSGACASTTVTVTVTPVNDAPPAPPTSAFDTPEDTPHTGTLPGSVDPDGDVLTFGGTDEPDHGTVTIDAAGGYTYTPDPGYFGPDSFGYEVCDPSGACASTTVTVTVTPVNDAPTAVDDVVATGYGAAVVVNPATNDTDPDGDALTITAADPAHGVVTVVGNVVTYTPDPGYSGADAFGYEVCDPSGACDTGTVTVTVGLAPPVNLAPVADAGTDRTVASGELVVLDGSGSSDPDGDDLTYAWVQSSGPTVTLSGANTAAPSFTGVTGPNVLTFVLTVSDGVLTDVATVTITVAPPTPTPDAPTCEPLSVDSGAGGVTVSVPCEDADDATYEVVDDPEHGDVEVLDDGSVRYVPDEGYTGTDAFTVRVCTAAGCTQSVVTVDVKAGTVTRPRVTPPTAPTRPDLPATGTPADMLVALAFVLVLVGATMQRRPHRA